MIRVLLFAGLAEMAGSTAVTIETSEKSLSVNDVKTILIEKYPAMSDLLSKSLAAVNQEYAQADQHVTTSDELAFIPPVSGG